jgi:3-dehydroquinate dehydratase/shikimate dehydrogenase
MLIAEHRHLADEGVKLVEWRLDFIRRPVNIKRLLENRPCPAIATVRRPQEGGKWQRGEADRLVLLRTAIADGVDYIDLEADVAGQIPRYGATKRIISYHNFHETPEHLDTVHEMLCELDPDIIKIATMANSPDDNLRVLKLCGTRRRVSTAAFCMGEMGLPSRILCGKFGSPMSFASFHRDRQLAPGQLSYQQMLHDYRYEQIDEATEVLGVIADPVGHSISPTVHNCCLREAGLDMVYLPFRVPAEHLDNFMGVCRQLGVRGLSVTIPHKEKILKHLTVLDDQVSMIRAANTAVFRGENAFGYNTDCSAAMECLLAHLDSRGDDRPLKGYKILVLGAGGTARAIAHVTHRAGAIVFVCARDHRKSETVAGAVGCKNLDWPARQNFECNVLINATSVGMHPNVDETPFEKHWLKKHLLVFDVVYNPERTVLIKSAQEFGCPTISGVDMFVAQAARQFELFTGRTTDRQLIRDTVKRALSPARA